MADAKFEVRGLAELERRLSELPQKIARNVLRGALRAGAGVIRAEAQANVPVSRGKLRKSIRVSTRLRFGVATARVRAGGRGEKGDAFYAHMVEFGTKPHKIKPKPGRALLINGSWVRGEVEHPGSQPRPFMRPALDAKGQESIQAVARYIRERLEKEAK